MVVAGGTLYKKGIAASKLGILFPRCPPKEAAAITAHTAARGSGRIGRTAAGRNLEKRALAVQAILADWRE